MQRVYASVLVNGTYEKATSSKGAPSVKYIPRSSSEMTLFNNIVKTAIGYSKTAKDKVVVANIPFKRIRYAIPAPPKKSVTSVIKSNLGEIVRYGVILIGIVLLILIILRPLMKYITAYESRLPARLAQEERLETLAQIKQESIPRPEPNVKDVAVNIVKADPDAATNYVKNLLKESNREI